MFFVNTLLYSSLERFLAVSDCKSFRYGILMAQYDLYPASISRVLPVDFNVMYRLAQLLSESPRLSLNERTILLANFLSILLAFPPLPEARSRVKELLKRFLTLNIVWRVIPRDYAI